MFVNTAVIVLVVDYDWRNNWNNNSGLVTQATDILISNAVVSPLLYFLNPGIIVQNI